MNGEHDITTARILVVDDETENLERIAQWLKRFGYANIDTALSAQEAVRHFDSRAFDVIVADMRMEKDDSGFAVIEEVQRRNITSVVIVLTANESVLDCRRAFKMGAWDYVPKNMPGNVFKTLHESIQAALRYFESWGNVKHQQWIRENIGYLLDTYRGKYVAVMNQAVIVAADTEDDVKRQLQAQKLPLFLTAITKVDAELFKGLPKELLIVFVEGPTDVKYLRTAFTILGRNDVLDRLIIDNVGNQIGNSGSGHPNLKNGFAFLKENRLLANKVLFLCDPDVKDGDLPNKGKDDGNLYVRRMEDAKDKVGIESFFAKDLFEEAVQFAYVQRTDTTRTQGSQQDFRTDYKVMKKVEMCRWICNERHNTPKDFEVFQKIIDLIESLL